MIFLSFAQEGIGMMHWCKGTTVVRLKDTKIDVYILLMVAFLFYCPVGDSSSLHIEIDAHLHRR